MLSRTGLASRTATHVLKPQNIVSNCNQQLRTLIINNSNKKMGDSSLWSTLSSSSLYSKNINGCYGRIVAPHLWSPLSSSSSRFLLTQAEANKSQTHSSSDSDSKDTKAQNNTSSENGNESTTNNSQTKDETPSSEKIEQYKAQITELEAEKAKLTDLLRRREADMVNLSNMSKKDAENARNYSIRKFARDMLTVADALQKALSSVNDQNMKGDSSEIKSLIEGIRLTEKSLMDVFARHGIKKFECKVAEDFDPNRHQALLQEVSKDQPAQTITRVLTEGYMLHDHVLRPASVGVAVAPPDTEKTETE